MNGDLFVEFRNKKRLLLQIDLAASAARRVEFGRAGAVGIAAADLALFSCDVADA